MTDDRWHNTNNGDMIEITKIIMSNTFQKLAAYPLNDVTLPGQENWKPDDMIITCI